MVWLFQRLLQQQHQPRTSLKPLPLPCPEAPASAQPASQPGEVWVAREGSRGVLWPRPPCSRAGTPQAAADGTACGAGVIPSAGSVGHCVQILRIWAPTWLAAFCVFKTKEGPEPG